MELMQAVEHYATAMKLAERYGNDHGDMDAANNAWYECKKAADRMNAATALATKQAEDAGLWFEATTVTEAHLQNALRELAAAIETPNVERNRDARHHRAAPVDGSVGPFAE